MRLLSRVEGPMFWEFELHGWLEQLGGLIGCSNWVVEWLEVAVMWVGWMVVAASWLGGWL